ncbi:hypothetical protein [Sediminitomix flava]|uniref:Uncharacterized protein n=1 Tax=Sediminitomix flava TaxID=379075 RepID=A0A315ZFF3_SEDFL|nr:hypothetical protein [Sediminitomix flava]PWJ44052.1 hypothetical protein BC781_101402 [Sediminitomix flava]
MKTIEKFSLKNIVIIDQYLSNRLDASEEKLFLKKLQSDIELKQDFQMVIDLVASSRYKPTGTSRKWKMNKSSSFNSSDPKLHSTIKDVIGYGIFAILAAGLLVFICSLAIDFFS